MPTRMSCRCSVLHKRAELASLVELHDLLKVTDELVVDKEERCHLGTGLSMCGCGWVYRSGVRMGRVLRGRIPKNIE